MEKWAFVTGATSGIGEATALELAKANYNLILGGRREARLQALDQKLSGKMKILLAPFDVRDHKAVKAFTEGHQQIIEQVEILINSAGLALGTQKFQGAELSDFDTMIDTNVKGLLYLTREVLPAMIKRNRGHIVNIGSSAGRWVYPGGAVYCASKFAVRAISEGLRMDLLGTPIRVTNIEPAMTETEFSEVRLRDKEMAKSVYQGMKPLTAQDVAETIMWVVQRPPHVNIQEIVVFPTDQAAVGMVHRA